MKKKAPPDFLPFLVGVLGTSDDPDLLARAREFFLDSSRRDALTELKLTEQLDAADLRTHLRERNQADLLRLISEPARKASAP